MRSISISTLEDDNKILRRSNVNYSIYAIGLSIILWSIFKYFYPHLNLTFDSYHYLMNMHLDTNAAGWPVGYSKIIRYVGIISHSENILPTIQYFINQIGFLIFFITIRIILRPNRWISLLTFIFFFINPINIFSSNHILSDPLYISLSIIWVAQIIWIIFRFKPYMIITQASLLFLLFDLRYNALYLPLITALAFLLAKIKTIWKITGIVITILFLATLIQYTSIEMEKISGVRQYAYSNGWKQASNGLYIYEHYYKNENTPLPIQFRELDSIVRHYFNNPHPNVSLLYPDQEITLGSYYMAVQGTPLYTYMQKKSGYKDWSLDFHRTAPYGPLYRSYGNYLILHHLLGYLKYVIYPHTLSYITPYPEIFTENTPAFSLWTDNIYGKVARDWYKIKTLKIADRYIQLRANILLPYPFIYTIIHIVFILSFLIIIIINGFSIIDKVSAHCLILLVIMVLGNFIFTVLSTTSVLRYQPAIIAIEFFLSLYFLNLFILSEYKRTPKSNVFKQ